MNYYVLMSAAILIICFLVPSVMDEAKQNNFHSLVCHGPEFTLVIKVMNLTVHGFLLHTLSALGS